MNKIKFKAADLKKVLRAIGPYFMEGTINYAIIQDGKGIAAANLLKDPTAFGTPMHLVDAIRANFKSEDYIIDYLFKHAAKIDELQIFTKDPYFHISFEKQLKNMALVITMEYNDDFLIRLYTLEKEVAPEPLAPAAPAAAVEALDPSGKTSGNVRFLHVGIPVTNKKPGMVYKEAIKTWMSDAEAHEFKIEYLKYEEGCPFPEYLHKNPHVAYAVPKLEPYMEKADRVVYGPGLSSKGKKMVFVVMDETLFELLED